MSAIRTIYDVATNAITFDNAAGAGWCDLIAALERHGQTIDIRGLRIGATVTIDGAVVQEISLPPSGVRYCSTDQNTLATLRIAPFPPDAVCTVAVWIHTRDGREFEAETTFTIPRPPQPYPSWIWDGGAWHAPEPYPDDGELYDWDEDAGAWVPYEEPA